MSSPSPLVTRGFGSNPMLVTQGFSVPTAVTPAVVEVDVESPRGRSRKKRRREEKEEYTMSVYLSSVNGVFVDKSEITKKNYIINENDIAVRVMPEKLIYRKSAPYKIIISDIRIVKERDDGSS